MTLGFRVERVTPVAPEGIYSLLAGVPAWKDWAPLVSYSELIRQGTPDPLGAGAIRRIGGLGLLRVDEEILEARPPHYQRYTAVRGIPVSRYHGEVHLDSVDGGTRLVWTGAFEPRIWGSGRLLATLLRLVIGAIATRAIAVAEQHSGTNS
jgi:Polyketide cyclase / dehydrase and lipid transport